MRYFINRSFIILLFLGLIPVIFSCKKETFVTSTGTDYYVKNGGNDSNTGLSDAQAWAHHPWMSSYTGDVTLSAGDIVYMKCGSTWTKSSGSMLTVAQNGTPGYYIKTTSYGTGAKPKFTVSSSAGNNNGIIYLLGKSYIIIDGLEIQGWSGTYGAGMGIGLLSDGSTHCHDIIITNCTIHEIPHTAVWNLTTCWNITVGDTTATTTATVSAYSNHIYNFGYAGVGLCGSNPTGGISNHKVYYNYIHNSTRTEVGANAYGIYFGPIAAYSTEPKYCYARYNNVQNILTWEGIDTHNGTFIYFQDNYIKNVGFQGFAISTSNGNTPGLLHHIYIDRNKIEFPASGWVTGRELGAIVFWNIENPSASTDIYIRDNTIFYTSRPASSLFNAITINGINGVTISGNTISNGPTVSSGDDAIYVYGSYVSNVIIENNFIKQWGNAIRFGGTGMTGSIKIRENIITKPVGFCVGFNNALPSSVNMELYNNVFLNDSYDYVFFNPYGDGTVTAKNNILGRASSGALYYWYLGSGTYNIDYNMYWNSTTSNPFYIGGGAKTFSVWQSTYGHDNHGYNETNPLFLNAGGSYLLDTDFLIPIGSPAKDKGVSVGLSLDYFGNTIGVSPDIGVHEF